MYCMCYKSLIGFRITVRNMNPFRFLQIALEGINLKMYHTFRIFSIFILFQKFSHTYTLLVLLLLLFLYWICYFLLYLWQN